MTQSMTPAKAECIQRQIRRAVAVRDKTEARIGRDTHTWGFDAALVRFHEARLRGDRAAADEANPANW